MLYTVFTRPWTCYTWHVTSDTDPGHVILDTWHVILDIWFMTPAHGIYTDTWHVTLDIWFMTPALGIYTGTWYLDTSIWHMSYLTPAPDTRYMTCFHVVQVHWLDIVTLDWTLPSLIPVLYDIFMTITFTGTWHDYYIITRYLVLMYSCILEPLK